MIHRFPDFPFLRADETLDVFFDGTKIFSSNGSWLHPLFELESFLAVVRLDRQRLFLVDTVMGKAAAILACRIGITDVYARVMSRLAADVFDDEAVRHRCVQLVDRIDCATEHVLLSIDDFDEAYGLLEERAGR